ncbi:MAG: DUF3562 domain-containing protein [Pseudomonadota bacterium]
MHASSDHVSAQKPVISVEAGLPQAGPYADAKDRSRHQHNIEQLAQEIDYPAQLIEPIYENLLARLRSNATVQDYLPILVAKGVRNALKEIAKQH